MKDTICRSTRRPSSTESTSHSPDPSGHGAHRISSRTLSGRSAYDAPAGLISRNEHVFASAQITSRLKLYGASYRTKLHDAVVLDSPLVVTKENQSFVWGIRYTFWQSSETVNRLEK